MITLQSNPINKYNIILEALKLYPKILWKTFPNAFLTSFFFFAPLYFLLLFKGPEDLNPTWIGTLSLSWLLGLLFLASLIFRIYCYCYNIPNHFLHSIQSVFLKWFSLLMLCVLYALVVLSGTMLFIIPGIILAVSLTLSFTLLITNNENVLQTLLTSHRLVWGHWWHTIFVLSIPLLLNIALSLAGFDIVVGSLVHIGASLPFIYGSAFWIYLLMQAAFIPFIYILATLLLHDLRLRTPLTPRW